MSITPSSSHAPFSNPPVEEAVRLIPLLTFLLFLSYLSVAMALPAVSFHVAHDLGFSNVYAGLAVGIAFISTLLTRGYAGGFSDRESGKVAMSRGLKVYVAASLLCLASAWPPLSPTSSYVVLIAGRLLLGLGESLAIVGVMGWGVSLVTTQHSGKLLAWIGAGMYGAFTVGGPLGLWLLNTAGLVWLMIACAVAPLLGLWLMRFIPDARSPQGKRESFLRVMGRIWKQGAVVFLQGMGFAGLGAFMSLYFVSRGWPHAGFGLTCFGLGFVAMRLLAGHLPDRIGGLRVAIGSLAIEMCGQYLLWLAPNPYMGLLGALLSGLGCSKIFPALGADLVKRVPPQLRGIAMGGFVAFQDLAYGFTGPVVGLCVDHFGYAVAFLIGGLAATLGLAVALAMQREEARSETART